MFIGGPAHNLQFRERCGRFLIYAFGSFDGQCNVEGHAGIIQVHCDGASHGLARQQWLGWVLPHTQIELTGFQIPIRMYKPIAFCSPVAEGSRLVQIVSTPRSSWRCVFHAARLNEAEEVGAGCCILLGRFPSFECIAQHGGIHTQLLSHFRNGIDDVGAFIIRLGFFHNFIGIVLRIKVADRKQQR